MRIELAGFVCALALMSGCSGPSVREALAHLKTADGKDAGTARFTPAPDGVSVELRAVNIPPGKHGVHVHEQGQCEPPDFNSAGGHFNPFAHGHDHSDPQGHHAGDLPNLTVGQDGNAEMTATISGVTMDGRGHHSLFHKGGTSVVIHAEEDDMKSAPSGHSGARLACGVIEAR